MLEALETLAKDKGLPLDKLALMVEDSIVKAYRSQGKNAEVHFDLEQGEIEAHIVYMVTETEELIDHHTQISLEEAKEINTDYEVGDMIKRQVYVKDFGRIAAQTVKGVVLSKIKDAEKEQVLNEFSGKEHTIVDGVIHRTQRGTVFVNVGKTETILLQNEQSDLDQYTAGRRYKFVVLNVRSQTKGGPQVYVSRASSELVRRLFEREVPELVDGEVTIVEVAREAGARTKISVHTEHPDIDPVGACVGQKGIRVENIVSELSGEMIDVIEWNENPAILISNALNPARVLMVEIYEEERMATVVVPMDQLSLAIGKEGQNVRLAAKLTGWKIDIKDEEQYKEYLREIGEYEEVYGEE